MKRHARSDPVTPEVRLAVFKRDGGCVAAKLDSSEARNCHGRLTLEHVKDQLRMGVRAPSDPAHLVALCDGHTESGARGGRQWNTAKVNRMEIRKYLISVNPSGSAS